MGEDIQAQWIAVDWGTSNLRAFAMQGSRAVSQATSADGMGTLERDGFEPALSTLIAPWQPQGKTVIACGMVGARQGWVEAPYRTVPCTPLAQTLVKAPTQQDLSVYVVPGISQARPPDVMRGEETQIAGFLAMNPGWDGVLCLPGTHTKWAHLSAGEVVSFQTFMTGEMFALMSEKSVLRHSVSGAGWDEEAFADAVSETISKPEILAARLFRLRAAGLLHNQPNATARASLSGYLIGAELAAARAYWLGQNIAVLGMGSQAKAYAHGLGSQGVSALMVDVEHATRAGLYEAYKTLGETS